MSRRRVDRLEGSLHPKETVKRWLIEAHAFGSLPAYVESLIDQPEAAQPFVALPSQVEKAVWETMRRERPALIEEVTRAAVGDTVFLLRLVIGLNLHLEETVRVEGLRHAALAWWARALHLERRAKGGAEDDRWLEWRHGVAVLRGEIRGTDQARAALEERYLDGHVCLFPDLAAELRDLHAAADRIAEGDALPVEGSVRQQAEQMVRQRALVARVDGHDAAGRGADSDALARRVLQAIDGPTPEA